MYWFSVTFIKTPIKHLQKKSRKRNFQKSSADSMCAGKSQNLFERRQVVRFRCWIRQGLYFSAYFDSAPLRKHASVQKKHFFLKMGAKRGGTDCLPKKVRWIAMFTFFWVLWVFIFLRASEFGIWNCLLWKMAFWNTFFFIRFMLWIWRWNKQQIFQNN